MVRLPSQEEALQFAIMIQAGYPASEAILYFTEGMDPSEVAMMLSKWTRSASVKRAAATLMEKTWEKMSLEEKIKSALDHTYSTMAYTLRAHHYGEVDAATKAKLDTARVALEQKLAGTAGKSDPLSKFFEDLQTGKIAALGARKVLDKAKES